MKKYEIINGPNSFNNIINANNKIKDRYFVIYYIRKEEKNPKFGIAVGKKVGNAVIRNKYKRKMRCIIDNNKFLFKKNFNYIIIVKKECLELDFESLTKYFVKLIEKVNS